MEELKKDASDVPSQSPTSATSAPEQNLPSIEQTQSEAAALENSEDVDIEKLSGLLSNMESQAHLLSKSLFDTLHTIQSTSDEVMSKSLEQMKTLGTVSSNVAASVDIAVEEATVFMHLCSDIHRHAVSLHHFESQIEKIKAVIAALETYVNKKLPKK